MQKQTEILPSLLDRLIDHEPRRSEPVQWRGAKLGVATESLLRDLENLFNTRGSIRPVPESRRQVGAFLTNYGARDFISHNPRSQSTRQQIRLEMERLLGVFEPRLRNVTVRLDPSAGIGRALNFRIDATVQFHPITSPITFDTCFDINNGCYTITK